MAITAPATELQTRYHATDYHRSDVKFRQRALVLRFIERYFPEGFPVRFLTMPGEGWLFELMALTKFPKASFVGVERSLPVYLRARNRLPTNAMAMLANRDNVQDRLLPYGTAQLQYSRISNGLTAAGFPTGKSVNRSNRLVYMDVNYLLGLITEDYRASVQERGAMAAKFLYRHAIWLDYTGTLNPKVLKALGSLHHAIEYSQHDKPVVITVCNCRDQFKSKEQRIAAIQAAQPALTIRRSWTYTGANGVSMLTVCGTIR